MNGRPRKTQEELDREMEDYWSSNIGPSENANGEEKDGAQGGQETAAPAMGDDEDIDMIT